MQVCPNPTSIAKNGATHAFSWLFQLCMMCVMCNFLELEQFGSANSKGVSKGCAWGLFGGNIV